MITEIRMLHRKIIILIYYYHNRYSNFIYLYYYNILFIILLETNEKLINNLVYFNKKIYLYNILSFSGSSRVFDKLAVGSGFELGIVNLIRPESK